MKNGIYDYGNYKCYYLNDKLHREDGPAIEWADGGKDWYINGKLHRDDGPAVECAYGYKWYYLDNISYTYEDWLEEIKANYLDGYIAYRIMNELS